MNKFNCPYCNKKSVSFFRKLILSPIVSHNCSNCNEPICVPFKAVLLILPSLLITLIYSFFINHYNVVTGLFVFGLILTSYFYNKYVPLIKAR
jgi:transcription elongation factor Elf1